jgi:hypothetical protein
MIMPNDTPAGNTAEVPVYEARTLYQVPIDRVREDPNQPRKSFDAQGLEEMVASVSKHGIIQPVIFRRGPDGTAIVKEEQQYPNEPQAFFDLLGKTGTKIDAVDTSAWLADDHNSLGIALTGLRDKIDTRLAAPPPEPAATTKAKKKLA